MPSQAQHKLLDTIIEIQDQQQQQIKPKGYHSAFIVHFILKAVPLGLLGFDQFVTLLLDEKYTTQLMLIFIVFEFWFTKNITGKRMLGYRWYFGQDQFGQERLMFQCRGNSQFVDVIKPKLFWVVQFVYCIVPVLFMFEDVFLLIKTVQASLRMVQLNFCVLASGIANVFFFLKVSDSCQQRQSELKIRLGMEYVRKLGLGSITSHY